jgi:hypothetical protein
MTNLNPAPTSSILTRGLNRGDLGLLVLALFFVAAQPPLETSASLLSMMDTLARQNLFFLFAMLVAGRCFLESGIGLNLTKSDWLVAGFAFLFFGVGSLFGVDQVAGLVLTLLVPALYFSGPRNLNFNTALMVCAALAINSFWGPLLFQSFTGEIISLDTTLLKWTYSVLRPDIVSDGTTFTTGKTFGIIVIGACSVFTSASVAFLASTAMAQHLKPGIRWRDGLVLAGVLLAMIAINTFRLALMGWSRPYYDFWHNGEGATIYSAAQTLLITFIAYLGARWSIRTSAP